MKAFKLKKLLPGMKVKMLDRAVLIAAGYENNSDPNDFLNLIAGKEITIKEAIDDLIYTSIEYPDIAIYKVFVEKIVYADKEVEVIEKEPQKPLVAWEKPACDI